MPRRRSILRAAAALLPLLAVQGRAARAADQAGVPGQTGPTEIPLVLATGAPPTLDDSPTHQRLDATQPVSVVDRQALDRFVAPTGNYDDAIRLTPSVLDVQPNGPGLGEAQTLSIRGFVDGQYNVTFDGIPFADSDDFTHHSSAYLAARTLAGVSVDRGPGDATTIGDATFGGTVSLRSIAPDADPSVSPEISIGSRATGLGDLLLNTGRTLPGGASALLDLDGAASRGQLDDDAQRRGTVFARLALPLGPQATLTLASNLARTVQSEPLGASRAEIATRGPSVALNDDNASQAFAPYNSSTYRTDLSYAALAATLPNGAVLTDRLYSYGLDRHVIQGADPNGETPNGTAFSPRDVPGQSGRNGLRAFGDILRLDQPLSPDLSLQTGAWLERQSNARSLVEIDLSRSNAPNPILDPVPGLAGSAALDRVQREDLITLQPYAQLSWHPVSPLRLTAGLKGALFDRSVDAPVMEGTRLPTRADRSFAALLPAFTAHLRLTAAWSAYLQLARGFLAPPLQFYDVADPATAPIAPEHSWNEQIGTVWRTGTVDLAADIYEIDFEDAVGSRTVGGQTTDFDEGGVTYRGVEGEGTIGLPRGLSLYGSFSANHARQNGTNGALSGPAPNTPQATIGAGLLFHAGDIDASLIDRWVGGFYGDVGGADWIDPTNQLDATIAARLRPPCAPPVEIRAQLFNCLDARKISGFAGTTAAASTPLFWTQAGRSLFVSVSTRF